MATAEQVLAVALKFVGTTEDPKGSNNVIFNTDYYGRPVSGDAYAWCVVFVWDIFRLAGASALFYDGKKVANTVAVEVWGKKAGLTISKDRVQRGDIVLFDFNHNQQPDHIGFALSGATNGKIQTVEGNTDDAVKTQTRNLSDVVTVIRPKYETSKMCNLDTCPILNYLKGLI